LSSLNAKTITGFLGAVAEPMPSILENYDVFGLLQRMLLDAYPWVLTTMRLSTSVSKLLVSSL
jgi:hypothetical protein